MPEETKKGSKLKGIIELIRPFTLLAPIIGGISGALMSFVLQGPGRIEPTSITDISFTQILLAIFGAVTLSTINAASNSFNAIYDEEIDRINKPTRPLVTGALSKKDAYAVSITLYILIIILSFLFNLAFFLCVLIIILVTIFYSMPPIRLKKRLWLSNISIAFARGFLGFMAAWCIFDTNPQDSPVPWLVGGIMFLVLVGATTAKDFTDVEGDAKFGMRTLPVVYGLRKSAIISSAFLIFPFLLVPIGWIAGILIVESLVMTLLMAWGALIAYLMLNAPMKQDGKMENSRAWGHMYFLLMTMQIGFALVYIIAGLV